MSSNVASLPARTGSPTRALLKPGNILPACVWLFLVFNQALNSPMPPSPSVVLLILVTTVTLVLFVVRRDATRVGGKADLIIALAGTLGVSFLRGPHLQDTRLLPTLVQFVALLGWAASLLTLGRSFGIVAADRGLVEHGPYRFVRHPIYAFEALFFLGFLIAVPTLRTAVIILASFALQIIRIVREERILTGYAEYRQRVRWCILPGVW